MCNIIPTLHVFIIDNIEDLRASGNGRILCIFVACIITILIYNNIITCLSVCMFFFFSERYFVAAACAPLQYGTFAVLGVVLRSPTSYDIMYVRI